MSSRPPVVFEEEHYLQWRREMELFRHDLDNQRQKLNALSVRRHQGTYIPPTAQRGIAVLTAQLNQGSSAAANELTINSSDALEYTGRSLTLWDWHLNSGESVASGTKLEWFKLGTRYYASNPYCAVSDTLPS